MFRLLIIRHAIAEARETAYARGLADAERALTAQGRKRMEQAARGLRKVVPTIDRVVSSPWLRALQTAEIVARYYPHLEAESGQQLLPDADCTQRLKWLAAQAGEGVTTLGMVGHEPDLSQWTSWLLSTRQTSFIQMKKGGICLLEFPNRLEAGRCQLLCALPPKQLRRLGKGR